MTHEYKNAIFIDFWNETFTTVISQPSCLVLRDAVKKVWSIVFSQCEDLLNGLKDYSISLMTVNDVFKGKPAPDITDDITKLCKGVELCRNRTQTNNFEWIPGVVEHMNKFWKLCEFADAASFFLKVRDALNLSGDFWLVGFVASRVRHSYTMYTSCIMFSFPLQAANSMKDQTLLSIDPSVADFLQDLASDERKRDCLKAYVESKEIVNWIREEIKGHILYLYG